MLTYFIIKSSQEIRIVSNFKVIYKILRVVLETLKMRLTLFRVVLKKISIQQRGEEKKTIYQDVCMPKKCVI